MGPDRPPALPRESWSDEQRRQADPIIRGPRGALVSPFVPLLRSPELMGHAQRMGEYLRYRSAIGQRLSELAILITARQWSQQVEWAIHAPIAESVGVDPATIAAIAEGRRPASMAEDERAVYDFCTELHRQQGVCDETWAAAVGLFGEHGVVDLIGINGCYTFLSMVMNAARAPAPPTVASPLPRLTARGAAT
jgi:4-carboxymuconolactone decarboxylase